MRKIAVILSVLLLSFFLFKVGVVKAEDESVAQDPGITRAGAKQDLTGSGWKQQLTEDRQQLQEQSKEVKSNMEAARDAERKLRLRIVEALKADDLQKAAQLKEELGIMHQKNVQEMQQDQQGVQAAKQELKGDFPGVKSIGDNNPPGPAGGPGTNWENPPGPIGGPGASPNRLRTLSGAGKQRVNSGGSGNN